MTSLNKLTKAQLIAKINEMEREIDAMLVAERPSRHVAMHTATMNMQRKLPAHMQAAKELAMRTGAVVRVMQ